MHIGKPPDPLPPAPIYAELSDEELRKLAQMHARDSQDFDRALQMIYDLRARSRWLSDDLNGFFPSKGPTDARRDG
jgi:hypothetical protein